MFAVQSAPSFLNDLKRRAQTGDYQQHGDADDADCIIGLSFGFQNKQGNIYPGISNQDMAALIASHYTAFPLLLQFEIAQALPADTPQRQLHEIRRHRTVGEYLDTREVLSQANDIMKSHQWQQALLIAHPYHVPRVDAICRNLGIRTIVPATLHAIRFDPNSEHPQTRNATIWEEYEPQAIDRDWARGWITPPERLV